MEVEYRGPEGCRETGRRYEVRVQWRQAANWEEGVQRAHQVDLVDEQDDVLRLLHLAQHRLEPLLKLAAVLAAGHERADVQGDDARAAQGRRHVALDDALRQALHDCRLAHACTPQGTPNLSQGVPSQDMWLCMIGPPPEYWVGRNPVCEASPHQKP